MKIIESVMGAVVSWLVPKLLDAVFNLQTSNKFLFFQWCISLSIGGAIGGFLSGVFGTLGFHTPGGFVNWTVFGAAIGISQWIVLRSYLKVGATWSVLSAISWSTWSYFQVQDEQAYLGWFAVGLVTGILQWLILIKRVRRSILWVPANILAWPVAGGSGVMLGFFLQGTGLQASTVWVLGWSCVGLVGGLILGVTLRIMPLRN